MPDRAGGYTVSSVTELTRDQITYLKKAQDLRFDVIRQPDGSFTGSLVAETRNKSGYTDSMIKIDAYGFIRNARSNHARHWHGAANVCDMWQTIAHFLKPGDMLNIRFSANDYRPIACGYDDFDLDVLKLQIIRGNKYYQFMLDIRLSKADAESYNQMIIRDRTPVMM
jgi:hypothetical protein